MPHFRLQLVEVGLLNLLNQAAKWYFRSMPFGLKRYQETRQTHFVTFSCFHRAPLLTSDTVREAFVRYLERTRRKYAFRVYAYVVMPEHIHLLVSEPDVDTLSRAIQSLKVSVAQSTLKFRKSGRLWQSRYYDHNVRDHESFLDKIRYIHRNPVKRGLCERPEDWKWSSFRHYASAEIAPVEIESQWTADIRAGRPVHLLRPQ